MTNVSLDMLGELIIGLRTTLDRIERKLGQVATRDHLLRQWRMYEDRLEVGREEMRCEDMGLARKLLELEARIDVLEGKPPRYVSLANAGSSAGSEDLG